MQNKTKHMSILIIDDDAGSIELISNILKAYGYKNILHSTSPIEALESLTQSQPDLILLDIIMPDIDGFTFCKKIKEANTTCEIPVIMITGAGLDIDETIEQTFNSGAIDFITKPLRSIELLMRVSSALAVKHNHDKILIEIAQRKKTEREREKVISQLQEALAEIKTLSGMIPICTNCKKIRDDKGFWNQIEKYIREHSNAEFTHSVCPECFEKLYPELDAEE